MQTNCYKKVSQKETNSKVFFFSFAVVLADRLVSATMDAYGFHVLNIAPSTRAAGVDQLYGRRVAESALAATHVQMWLNMHCNEKMGLKSKQ